VIFTAPVGKAMGGKVGIAVVHAIVFVIIVKLLNVCIEGFTTTTTTTIGGGVGGPRVNSIGWTSIRLAPSDPAVDVRKYESDVAAYQDKLTEASEDLRMAREALSRFEPSGSTFRAKCMSVKNTSCPTIDGQKRLFGADDCATLGGGYRADGICGEDQEVNYSTVCALILNRLAPVSGQDQKCIAARAALAAWTPVKPHLRSLMDLTSASAGSGPESCGSNKYYNAVTKRCALCSTAPPFPATNPSANYTATKDSINAKCAPTSAAWKKVNPSGSGTR